MLDQAICVWLPGPQTVTGEDMAEFHVHGSPAVVASLLASLSKLQALRLAHAGEFTRRAFFNGKMDLVEVEGLGDLLNAETDVQRRLAMRQFTGEASRTFETWRDEILQCLALFEAAIDFSEDDEEVQRAFSVAEPRIKALILSLTLALEKSRLAGLVRLGTKIVIAGPPNAGKSSLLNWLARREVSLVTPHAGTTRDIVETRMVLDGMTVMVSDTAGLRVETSDPIEELGMAKARAEVAEADILIWLTSPDTEVIVRPPREPDLCVLNKSDLWSEQLIHNRNDSEIAISIRTGDGLMQLKTQLSDLVKRKTGVAEDAIVVRERHISAVCESIRILNDVSFSETVMPLEVVAERMRKAAGAMAAITGRVDVEDVLGHIFASFCIGK
jgi:tRNA modification GTPase